MVEEKFRAHDKALDLREAALLLETQRRVTFRLAIAIVLSNILVSITVATLLKLMRLV